MAITEQKVWATTRGSQCATLEQAETLEFYQQVGDVIQEMIDMKTGCYNQDGFLDYIKKSPDAVPFMEALLDAYSHNPYLMSKNDAPT